ncbi:ABC transporter ATP-binding protein [Anaerosalibacter sp. Marseille-P3206]|uniref:ABC transporter ATP-binding protein n=1 Tax=Anaerosalibacter sp. Marseille-P3206 TaxID=1871005 RepID=UPI000984B7CD|nr:ABC transporter ATP-binding protein [Anaerosalibacter sp. Marseille-P3206]
MSNWWFLNIERFKYNDNEDCLKDIFLQIKKGEFIVITGLSGCGKSTLIRIINGLIPEFYEGIVIGDVKFKGRSISQYKKGELAKYMGNVFQDPKDQFFSTQVEDEIALVGENLGMNRSTLFERVEKAIEVLDLKDLRDKSVFELSGGEKQRVAIASSLVYDTYVIIFDEPSASLDYVSTLSLKSILKQLKEMGKTIIIAEHRLFYLTDLCDRLVYMKDKTIEGIYDKDMLTSELRKNLDLRCFKEEELEGQCIYNKTESELEAKGIDIKVKDRILSKDINFTVAKGEIMAILGKNGVGKTTLLKQLAGLLNMNGFTSWGKNKRERIKNVYYVMQDADSQIFYDTVENEILVGNLHKPYLEKVKYLLKKVDLWDKRLNHPQELSSGEKQRLTVITAIVQARKLLILDEPTAGLDYRRMNQMAEIIREAAEVMPIILVTHDMELLFKCASTAFLLDCNSNRKIHVKGGEKESLSFLRGKKQEY